MSTRTRIVSLLGRGVFGHGIPVRGIDSRAVPDLMSLRMLLVALASWLDRRHQDTVAYLIEENRILRGHVRGRIRLTDENAVGWRYADTSWTVAAFVMSPP
jgi:hypothetical protein